jgi:hypothetical protein
MENRHRSAFGQAKSSAAQKISAGTVTTRAGFAVMMLGIFRPGAPERDHHG